MLCKSMDWFLYDNGLRHERVKDFFYFVEKSCFVLKLFKFFDFQLFYDLSNLWRRDEY